MATKKPEIQSFQSLVLRVLDGMRDVALAETLGVSTTTVWAWTKGRRVPLEPGFSVWTWRLRELLPDESVPPRRPRKGASVAGPSA